MSLNSVNLTGRLTADPELRYTPNGVAVAKFTLAVNRNYKNKEGEIDADFVPVEIWKGGAEALSKNVGKGRRIGIEGELVLDRWENEEGDKRSRLKVKAYRFHFLDYKKEVEEGENPSENSNSSTEVDEDIEVPF